jgi:hypothetical protein
MKSPRGQKIGGKLSNFHLISTDSYEHVGKCVGDKSHRHSPDSQNIGRHNRMTPMCRADIHDMSATDTIVWRLGGAADRRQTHRVCRHFQPNRRRWLVTRSRRGCLSVPISSDQLKSSSLGFYVPVETLLCFCPTINIVTLTNNLHFLH